MSGISTVTLDKGEQVAEHAAAPELAEATLLDR
jgi:hypothetical protein